MSDKGQKVAIITGGSQGIGASLVTANRRRGWSVVATARAMKPAEDPDVLTVDGDLADPATAGRIVSGALGHFGRIDTLINNAGVDISKPFTDYTAEDYALVVGVNLTGFFWLTQRAIAEMLQRCGGHVVNISATPCRGRELQRALGPGRADQGWPGLGHPVTRRRARLPRHPGQRRLAGHHPGPGAPGGQLQGAR